MQQGTSLSRSSEPVLCNIISGCNRCESQDGVEGVAPWRIRATSTLKRLVQLFKAYQRIDRVTIARTYLRGNGIEIGALNAPLQLPLKARARYVDRLPVEELRRHYPELAAWKLVDVDVVDDGERLEKIEDGSQSFVTANHFLEHCQNPILALENMLRVVREGGIVYLAVPDKRYTFDRDRPVTSFEHLKRDFE